MSEYVSLTVRFSRRDYERMQELIKNGEYVTISEIVREAVKKFLREKEVV